MCTPSNTPQSCLGPNFPLQSISPRSSISQVIYCVLEKHICHAYLYASIPFFTLPSKERERGETERDREHKGKPSKQFNSNSKRQRESSQKRGVINATSAVQFSSQQHGTSQSLAAALPSQGVQRQFRSLEWMLKVAHTNTFLHDKGVETIKTFHGPEHPHFQSSGAKASKGWVVFIL